MGGPRRDRQRRPLDLVRNPASGGNTPLIAIHRESFTTEYLPYISCVILGPGPGSPHKVADFSWPKRLIEEYGHVLPIFGLCLGLQGLAITYGGHVSTDLLGEMREILMNCDLRS